jgi:hypothetical protein
MLEGLLPLCSTVTEACLRLHVVWEGSGLFLLNTRTTNTYYCLLPKKKKKKKQASSASKRKYCLSLHLLQLSTWFLLYRFIQFEGSKRLS